MKKKIIGIYSKEMGYASHLMDYLNDSNDVRMEVCIFTEEESLFEYLTSHKINVLLVDEAFKEMGRGWEAIPTIIWLTDENTVLDVNKKCIYKFQRLDHIVKDLVQILMQCNEGCEVHYERGRAEIISLFSPFGGTGELAEAIAEILAETYSTLRINMEWFSVPIEGKKGVSDLLYFIHERKLNFTLFLTLLTEKNGVVDVIHPVNHFKDLLDLDAADVHRLLKELRRNGNYEKIIIHLDHLGENTFEMLDGCDRIIVPIWKNKIGKERLEAMKRHLKMEDKEDLAGRLCIVEMPFPTTNHEYLRKKASNLIGGVKGK